MSMYHFVKDNSSGSKRLFVQGTTGNGTANGAANGGPVGPPKVTSFSNMEDMNNLQAVITRKRLSAEVLGSSLESTKTSRKSDDGTRRITTRILRKVTTMTRGEEKKDAEGLVRKASMKRIEGKVQKNMRKSDFYCKNSPQQSALNILVCLIEAEK